MSTATNLTAVPLSSVKRKTRDVEDDENDSDSGSDVSMINVDFDFYNPNPEVDDITLNRFLTQLLSSDSQLFDIHSLATLLLKCSSDYGVGSCVKVDGEESDPYCFLGIVGLREWLAKATEVSTAVGSGGGESSTQAKALKGLVEYLLDRVKGDKQFHTLLSSSLTPSTSNTQQQQPNIALLISERLINLPIQLIPPMYNMLLSELEEASKQSDDKSSLGFTHFLILSRVYVMPGPMDEGGLGMDEDLDGKQPPSKKSKKQNGSAPSTNSTPLPTSGTFLYHPEEEFLESAALHTHTYALKNAQPRNEESFGVDQRGRVVLIEASKMKEAVKKMGEVVGGGGA